jgi:hypothetical protein
MSADSTARTPSRHPAVRPLDAGQLRRLMDGSAGTPAVSIYLPTHRKSADTRQNGIRFKTLLQQAKEEVGRSDHAAEAEAALAELDALADDNAFWQHQLDGLAVFRSPTFFAMYRLGRPVEERVAVADSFHVKPLVRILQTAGTYQLLALTQKSVTLYEGTMDRLDEVPLDDEVPTSIKQALGSDFDGQLNANSYGGLSYSGMFHGHHDRKDDRDADLERYIRAVDRAVYEFHGRESDLPLYFAGDVDYHDRFFKISHHPRLVKKGVRINPDAVEVGPDRLRAEMADVIRPDFEEEVHELVEQFGNAKAKGQGSDQIADVAQAAAQGRVLTLLVDQHKSVGGRLEPGTGVFTAADESEPDADDVLDDLCELCLKTDSKVRVIPSDVHPSQTGVAAVYRY